MEGKRYSGRTYFDRTVRLNITIHRGTREIGGTCIEIVHGNNRIVLDIGMPLVKPGGKPFKQREI